MISMRQIQQFIAVAEELHFNRAAARLGMAQSPLSQAIRGLEERIGVPLFERDRRGVELTAAGRVFLNEARALVASGEQAIRRARWAHEGGDERLAIGFVGSTGYTLLPQLVREFHSAHPGVRLAVIEGTSISQVEALRSGRLDLGIIRATGAETPFLSTKVLLREHMLMALPRSHPLAKNVRIRLAELSGDKFVLFAPAGPAPMHAMLVSTCREAGFEPTFEYEVQHLPSAIGVVASGAAVAMLPASLAAVRHKDVVFKRLVGAGSEMTFDALAAWSPSNDNPSLGKLLATLPDLSAGASEAASTSA